MVEVSASWSLGGICDRGETMKAAHKLILFDSFELGGIYLKGFDLTAL